jgi:3-deoxy-D-manno-octulosonic acid kinase
VDGRASESPATEAVRQRYAVPGSIRLRVGVHDVLAFVAGHETSVRSVASAPDALPQSDRGGRAPLRRLETPLGPVLVRRYRKGGLLRHLRGRRFLGAWRPLEELVLLCRLGALRLPVIEGVGAVVHLHGRSWSGWLLTREVGGSVDLDAWLRGRGPAGAPPAPRVARRAGRAVRELHDAGVRHADLHPKNLLLTPQGQVLVLDLDKARCFDRPLSDAPRAANLLRLARAVDKLALQGTPTSARLALRFLEGYAGTRAAARSWFERLVARRLAGRSLRGAWWRLSGQTRSSRLGDLRGAP